MICRLLLLCCRDAELPGRQKAPRHTMLFITMLPCRDAGCDVRLPHYYATFHGFALNIFNGHCHNIRHAASTRCAILMPADAMPPRHARH